MTQKTTKAKDMDLGVIYDYLGRPVMLLGLLDNYQLMNVHGEVVDERTWEFVPILFLETGYVDGIPKTADLTLRGVEIRRVQ